MGRAHLTGRLRRPRTIRLTEGFLRRNLANLRPPIIPTVRGTHPTTAVARSLVPMSSGNGIATRGEPVAWPAMSAMVPNGKSLRVRHGHWGGARRKHRRVLNRSSGWTNSPTLPGGLAKCRRFLYGRGDDVGIVNFLRDTLMEKIGLRTPGFQGRFHGWGRYGLVEEAEGRLIRFEFSCHEAPAAISRKPSQGRFRRHEELWPLPPVRFVQRRIRNGKETEQPGT
jgi:hypothetical protein